MPWPAGEPEAPRQRGSAARDPVDVLGHEALASAGDTLSSTARRPSGVEVQRVQQRAALVGGGDGEAEQRGEGRGHVHLLGASRRAGPHGCPPGEDERDVHDGLLGPAVAARGDVTVVRGHHERVAIEVHLRRQAADLRVLGLRRRPGTRREAPPHPWPVSSTACSSTMTRAGGLASRAGGRRPASASAAARPRSVATVAVGVPGGDRRRGRAIHGAKRAGRPRPAASAGDAAPGAAPSGTGVLDAQRPRVVVRGLAVDLLPGPAEHHRPPGQREGGLADPAVGVGALRARSSLRNGRSREA